MSYQTSSHEPENRFQDVLAAFADAQREREAVRRPAPRNFYRQAPREVRHFQKSQGRPQPAQQPSSLDEAFGHYFRQA